MSEFEVVVWEFAEGFGEFVDDFLVGGEFKVFDFVRCRVEDVFNDFDERINVASAGELLDFFWLASDATVMTVNSLVIACSSDNQMSGWE